MKTASANAAQGTGFLPIFKTLLQEAGQVDVAFGAQKKDSDERKSIEKWIEASTAGQEVPIKELDEQLKNRTYVASNKLTAADIAVFGALNTYIVGLIATSNVVFAMLMPVRVIAGSSIA